MLKKIISFFMVGASTVLLFLTFIGISMVNRSLALGKDISIDISMTLFCLVLFIGFVMGTLKSARAIREEKEEERERIILGFLKRSGGKVTPIEIASNSSLSLKEAKAALVKLMDSGNGTTHMTEDGQLLYVFEGFMDQKSKDSSEDLFKRMNRPVSSDRREGNKNNYKV